MQKFSCFELLGKNEQIACCLEMKKTLLQSMRISPPKKIKDQLQNLSVDVALFSHEENVVTEVSERDQGLKFKDQSSNMLAKTHLDV